MSRLRDYSIVIFDCDGVIIDSNLLKCEAFGSSVSGYSEPIIKKFVEHCKQTFGVSRYVKFKEFFTYFAKEQFDQDKYNLFLQRYSSLCKELYYKAEITSGAKKLFSSLVRSEKRLFVASGSDEQELIDVFTNRNLVKFFEKIYGSPKKKEDCIHEILDNEKNKKAVLIGDSISDLYAAIDQNIDFIYMTRYTVQSKEQDIICRNKAHLVIDTLEDLL